MKNINLIICLLIFPFALSAQNPGIDTLKNKLKKLPQDSVYVNILNRITTAYIQEEHFDSAIRYAKPAVEWAEKLSYLNGAVAAYYNLAEYNFHIQEYKPGKALLFKSLNAALQVKDNRSIANNYKALANLYHLQGNFKLEADSKNKFTLYNDSATIEENAKLAAATAAINAVKEKEKNELAANEAKIIADNDAQKQRIFYISLIVFVILSILLIWLLVSRSKKAKKQAAFLEQQGEPEQIDMYNNTAEQKSKEKDTPAFLQKIAEKEALLAKTNNGGKEPEKEIAELTVPIPEIKGNTAPDEKNREENPVTVEENSQITKENSHVPEAEPQKFETIVETKKILVVDAGKPETKVLGGSYSTILSLTQVPRFSAKLINDKVKLVWETNAEQTIACFELEKSVDAMQFVAIETIAAANGSSEHVYEAFDFKCLPGKNYYRLKINDKENNFIYSQVVEIEVLPATTLTLVCYPTHAKDVIMVTAAGGKLPVVVNIYDTTGKKQFFIEVPPTTTPVYISNLSDGTYSLQMKCQGKTVLQQLVKKSQ